MKKTKILSLLTAAVLLVATILALGISSFAAEESKTESKGTIDVWLIGGQSNAVGYGDNAPAEADGDHRYYTGFDNTLFYGVNEVFTHNIDHLTPVTLGKGQFPWRSGAEVGIAKAVDGTGRPNAVIKCAVGATSLYPHLTADISKSVGTWTSPSYIERANMSTSDPNYQTMGTFVDINGNTQDIPYVDLSVKITNGNADNQGNVMAGNMYNMFIKTVTEGIRQLKAEGYTPVVRGMWWMQGEAECYNDTQAYLYDELLTCLINDVREDVAEISGDASVNSADSPMPFLAGNIIWLASNAANAPKHIPTVNAAQAAVASAMKNVNYLDKDITNAQSFFGQQDNWHYNVATQQFFGEQLVKYVLECNNQSLVTASGDGVIFAGGGTLANGTSATVSFTAKENYKINGVTLNGVAVDYTQPYTFTVDGNTAFLVDTEYTGAIETVPYGTITAEYGDADNYPFALFKNGSFVSGYASYRTAMMAIPTGSSSDSYVILLRRDYTTAGLDGEGAARITNIGADVTLDLGTNAMTRAYHDKGYIFDIYHSSSATYTTNVTVKNGTIVSAANNPLIGLNYSTASAGANTRTYNFTFNEVNVINKASSRNIPMIAASWENGSSVVNAGIKANITLNGCTVDFGNITNGVAVGFTNDAKDTNTVGTLTVNGGNIISGGSDYSLAATDGADTVKIGAYNGSYPKVTLPSGTAPSTETYKDVNGVSCGTVAGTGVANGNNTVYTFAPNTLVTPYGTIDAAFENVNTYPFAIFNADGFVTCVTNFKDAVDKGLNSMKNKESVVYLRSNYDNTSNDATDGLLTYINGTLKIDLGGNVLARGSKTLFDVFINGKATSGYVTNIAVSNGTLMSKDGNVIIAMDYNGSSSSQVTGVVKQFNMSFTNVTFCAEKPLSNGRSLVLDIWDNARDVKYQTKSSFDFYGCTFDMTNANGKHPFRMNDRTNRNPSMDVAVNVYGGEFLNMGQSWMAYMDAGDTTNFGKYEGKYPTLTTAAGVEIRDVNSNFGALGTGDNNDRTRIIKTASDSSYNYYTVSLQESTPYGNINAKYGDTSKYPMAFFKYDAAANTYTFLKAGTFKTLKDYYYSSSNTAAVNIVAYLRVNHVVDESVDLAKINGNVILDLDGKTLTRDPIHIFDIYNIGTNGVAGFASSVTVKNGTVNSKQSFAIGINSSGISGKNKIINFTFDNVTFTYAAGNTTNQGAFFNCWKSDGADEFGSVLTFTFNNCTYDFTNAPKNSYMFDFTGLDSTQDTDISATFNGGTVIAPSMAINWKVFTFNSAEDNVYFGENAITVNILASGTQPGASNSVVTSNNTYSYIAAGTNGSYNAYTLEVFASTESTPYGNITGLTEETASKANYPVAVFVPSGDSFKYVGVYKTLSEALVEAAKVQNSVIMLRDNLTPSADKKSYFVTGTIIVDLNGFSYTKDAGIYLLDSYIGATTVNCNITFKNGTIKKGSGASGTGLFCFNYHKAQTTLSTFNMTFDNVKLVNEKSGETFLFSMWEDGFATETTKGILVNATFNNCEINAGNAIVFTLDKEAGNTQNKTVVNVTVNGGKFVGSSAITVDKFIRKNGNDTLTFGKYEGSYPEFVYPAAMGYTPHRISFNENGTEYTLTVNRTEGNTVIYAFAPTTVVTEYGKIPAEYDNIEAYPFILFNTDKTIVGGYAEWGATVNAAVANNVNGNFIILMRRNAPQNVGGGVEHFNGTITADLGGFTLIDENNQYIWDAWVPSNATERIAGTLIMKNGNVAKNGPDALFCINYGGGLTAKVTHTLIFENVKFTLNNKANGLFVTWENGKASATANQIADITFNNCTFDLANSEAGAVPFILTMGDGTGTIFNITVNGGKIIANNAMTYNDLVIKNDNENVVFAKDVILALPTGAAAPDRSNVWSVNGVNCVFVKSSESDGYVNYSFYPEAMVGYKIKTSVTP